MTRSGRGKDGDNALDAVVFNILLGRSSRAEKFEFKVENLLNTLS